MNDTLKNYIAAHRDAFDTDKPSAELWSRIEGNIAMKPAAPVVSIRAFRRSLLAAVAVVTAVSVAIFHPNPGDGTAGRSDNNRAIAKEEHSAATMPGPGTENSGGSVTVPDSLYDREFYYMSRIIHTKFQEVSKIKEDHPELYDRFASDLRKLDSTYQQLKQQLPGQVNQEMLLQAMLQNLTLQVDLINRQLGIIHQLQKESHEKVTKRI